MNSFTIESIALRDIALVKPLWEKLNALHLADSVHFKDHFASFTFEKRMEKFMLFRDDDVFIELAVDTDGIPAGYCISTAEGPAGELDSLYVEEKFRGRGIGERLVRRSLEWLREKKCARIMVGVAHGHESVLPFYGKFGFLPRFTYLQLKD